MNILSMDNQVPTWAQIPIIDYVRSDPYSHTFEFICEYSISLKENETGYRIQATSIAEVTKRSMGLLLSPLLWLSNLSLQPLPLASSGAFPHTRVRQSMDLTHEWVCLHARRQLEAQGSYIAASLRESLAKPWGREFSSWGRTCRSSLCPLFV